MKFQVPQFIETEIKLVGPFTIRQFLWTAFGAILLYILYLALPGFLFIVMAIPVGAIFGALGFATFNGAPLINYVSYMLNYALNPKKYVYKKFESPATNYASEIMINKS